VPKAKRTGKALVAAEARAALARLASKGAYAVAAGSPDGAGDRWAIYAPRNGFAEPVLHVSRLAIEHGLHKGWLEPGDGDGRLRLAAAGLRALRVAKATPARHAQPGPGRCTPKSAQAPREGPLAWLRDRKDRDGRPLITQAQFDAGQKLAGDFWHAQLSPRVTADWSAAAPGQRVRRTTPGAGVEMNERVAMARQRVSRALEAVGPELAGILLDVCCLDVGLEDAGQASGWPRRAAKVVLDLALTRLARHYGLIAPERPLASRLRHWGDETYRPTLDGWR
jgi:hypothetical protein